MKWRLFPFVVLSSIAFVGTFVLPHVVSVVCLKLISHGDAANVPYAQSKLASQSLHVRAAASEALGTIGPRAEAAVNDLIKVLNKDTAFVASQAAWALGEIHADREDAIDALITALRSHKDGEVRRYAAYALSRYGAAGRKAVPALIEALHDPHMAYMAVVSLEAMNASETARDIAPLLESAKWHERAQAIVTLTTFTPLPEDIRAAIAKCEHDPDPRVRQHAVAYRTKVAADP